MMPPDPPFAEGDPSEPSIRIGLASIYTEVVKQGGKLDLVISELHEVRNTDTDHETRIRKIEDGSSTFVTHTQARAWLAAILTVAGLVVALVALLVHR